MHAALPRRLLLLLLVHLCSLRSQLREAANLVVVLAALLELTIAFHLVILRPVLPPLLCGGRERSKVHPWRELL